MDNCIFCKIIKGELPSKTIYEDETIKVIMNINPATDGHLLILPKEHIVTIMDINEDLVSYITKVIKEKLYSQLKEKLNCEGLTICQNNDLGQEVKHFHVHLIPRYQNDNGEFQYNKDNIKDLDEVFTNLTK